MSNSSLRPRNPVARYGTLIIASVFCVAPLLLVLATSLSPSTSRLVTLESLFNPTLSNYVELFTGTGFGHWMINSLVAAIAVTVIVLFLDSLAGYAFAKRRFRGRELLFGAMLATLMIPLPVTLLPTFLMMSSLGLTDTFPALIAPGLATTLGVFLMRQFIESIPDEIEEAAVLDGASSFGIYWRIILPLSVPALAVLALFTFLFQWSSLLWPLIITASEATITLPPGLSALPSQFSTDYGLVAAGSVLSIIPMLVVFLSLRRYLGESTIGSRSEKG